MCSVIVETVSCYIYQKGFDEFIHVDCKNRGKVRVCSWFGCDNEEIKITGSVQPLLVHMCMQCNVAMEISLLAILPITLCSITNC